MKVRLVSLGCKVNQYEIQALASLFSERGYTITEQNDADVTVINSCTVTSLADRKSRQAVRRLRREMPDSVIALMGCMPQADPDAAAQLTEADIVTGVKDRAKLIDMIELQLKSRSRSVSVPAFSTDDLFEPLSAERFSDSFQRAYLKIEDGCDRYCSYCIIPFARGRVRSRSLAEITAETQKLVKSGYREIVLTGINLSRYGADIGLRLKDAVAACAEVDGDFRIRLGSVEPDLISDGDWLAFSEMPKFCPHFHLAVQSGCDKTLKAMNRHYTMAQFFDTVSTIRRLFSNPSVTADIIVGFPGESDDDFEETCRNIAALGLLRAHIFEYSPRKGTVAARRGDQIDPQVKKQRAKRLEAICSASAAEFAKGQVGSTARVLLEATGGGYTDNYLYVSVSSAEKYTTGDFINVTLTAADGPCCIGEVINADK